MICLSQVAFGIVFGKTHVQPRGDERNGVYWRASLTADVQPKVKFSEHGSVNTKIFILREDKFRLYSVVESLSSYGRPTTGNSIARKDHKDNAHLRNLPIFTAMGGNRDNHTLNVNPKGKRKC